MGCHQYANDTQVYIVLIKPQDSALSVVGQHLEIAIEEENTEA